MPEHMVTNVKCRNKGGHHIDIKKLMQTGEGIEKLGEHLMDLDATFRFKCRKCGRCCKNQDMILFTPNDLFKIAQKLGNTIQTIINDYTEIYIGPQSKIPLVHLLMQGPKNACPFLEMDSRCSIHDSKPVICALYPLGRVFVNKNPGAPISGSAETMVRYINNGNCGSGKKVHTVRDWLTSSGIPENDEFFLLWTRMITELGVQIRNLLEKGIPEKWLQPLWNAMFFKLCLDYDIKQEFMPQFQRNADKLLLDMPELCQLLLSAAETQKSDIGGAADGH